MTDDQNYVARIFFQNKVLKCNGQAFQDLFGHVMQLDNPNFEKVKPQGRIGDKKNDGFDKTTGTYYQVYSPESPSESISSAITKLAQDFKGLYAFWNSLHPIKEFHFVFNDKYDGAYPTLYESLSTLNEQYPHVAFDIFGANKLEVTFSRLEDDQKKAIVGLIPDSLNINSDFNALNEVVHYLMNLSVSTGINETIPDPDFYRKIQFNQLGEVPKRYLESGNIHDYALIEYFKYKSSLKTDLQKTFSQLYISAKTEVPDVDGKADLVFFAILHKACPENKKPVIDAVLILMAYYFEFCDIFETPGNDSST